MSAPLVRLIEAVRAKDSVAVQREAADVRAHEHGGFELTVAAVDSKEAGYRDVAEALLRAAISAHPDCAVAHYELGVMHRDSGRHNPAVVSLVEACRLAPDDFRYAALLIQMLHAIGARPEAAQEAERAANLPDADPARLQLVNEFGRYLAEFPAGRARYFLDQLRRSYRWVDAPHVAREINQAIDERRGFSLVRLGDGEGAFARISADDEARYATLYAWIRRDWATALYGQDFDPLATGYAALVETLMRVCAGADIAGLPYPSWVDHEYKTAAQRGVPCLVNVHRWFLTHRDMSTRPLLCDQIIHVELHSQGLLEPILRRSRRIGLISSNQGLSEVLKSRFELDDVEMFKIPAERYSSGVRDAEALAGVHFPFAFWDIIRRLSQPQHGRVFLIAAGTLAKFYAATIKQHGGVALDIGSLVDGWMRIPSRPGYDDRLALGL